MINLQIPFIFLRRKNMSSYDSYNSKRDNLLSNTFVNAFLTRNCVLSGYQTHTHTNYAFQLFAHQYNAGWNDNQIELSADANATENPLQFINDRLIIISNNGIFIITIHACTRILTKTLSRCFGPKNICCCCTSGFGFAFWATWHLDLAAHGGVSRCASTMRR